MNQQAWEWWAAILGGLAAAGFGAYGLWLYEVANGGPVEFPSIGYHTLQLFALHAPHLEHPVPWQLHVGRWLAALVVLGAIARGLAMIFWSECRLFWARFSGDHTVVCGLGRMGMQLAEEFRRQNIPVVAIDISGGTEEIADAYHLGVAVIKGDACSPKILKAAGIDKASRIIAACDDDQKNVAIAAKIGELLTKTTGSHQAQCWLFISDPRVQEVLRQDGLFPHTGNRYQVNVRGLDFFELAARRILRKVPLDFDRIRPEDRTVVRLVICGFGSMGQYLALQAARIGHFANFRKLRVTILEQTGSARPESFLLRYPRFKDVCDFQVVPIELADSQFDTQSAIRAIPSGGVEKELMTVAACWESTGRITDEMDFLQALAHDDPANLSFALALAREGSRYPRVLVFQTRKAGFGALFPVEGRGKAVGPRLFPFGMMEDTWSVETLLHEREDEIAKALHKDYYEKQLARGKKPEERPALYKWQELHERFRESNRRASDHIGVKLRAIGYVVSEMRKDLAAIDSFDEYQLDLLARMEHESWCAEWLLQGYIYGPGERDDVAKTQPYLVDWDKLPEDVKKWDKEQVKVIPEALKRVRLGIYPQVQ
jgi:TrkA-N domain/RyR domain